MFLQIELLYFVLMIGSFIALILFAKLPTGLCMMISSLIGAVASALISKTEFGLRYFVEGTFGYLDTILVITSAMVFMGAMQASGALEYISALLVRAFRRVPSVLLVAFMIIIMFPAMVTGSSLASAISAGALVAPIMIKWGIPKARVGAIVGIGSILGMVAPPINVPAMVICDVVDIPFTGFTLPLLLLTIPLAIVCALLLGRKYVKPLAADEVDKVVNTDILKELNFTVVIPLIVLIVLIVMEMVFPTIFGSLAMTGMFVISTAIVLFVGRRLPFWVKPAAKAQTEEKTEDADGEIQPAQKQAKTEQEAPKSVIDVISQGVHKSFSAMGLLMGVGMFMETITLNGVRGFFVYNAISLPNLWKYFGMAVSLPLFGGISAFGSASMLGGPFVMALGNRYAIMVTSGLSLLAAIGEFSPPTAMSAVFASTIVGEKKWTKISVAALPALGIVFAYTLVYILWFAKILKGTVADKVNGTYLVLFAIMLAIALAFAVVWEVLVRKVGYFKKFAYQVGSEQEAEQVATEQTATEEA